MPEKKRSGKMIVILLLLIVCIAAVSVLPLMNYQFEQNYAEAVAYVDQAEFEKAYDAIDNQVFFTRKAPGLAELIATGRAFERSGSSASYKAVKELAESGDIYAQTAMAELTEKAFETAVAQYRAGGNEYNAEELFTALGKYENSQQYLYLLQMWSAAETGYPEITDKDMERLLAMIEFEDVKSLLVAEVPTASKFLLGKWKTADKEMGLTFTAERCTVDGLPYDALENSTYMITQGTFLLESDSETVELFKFTVSDENTMDVYCFKDGETYTMYRK